MIDFDQMKQLVSQFYFPVVEKQHGSAGVDALRQLLNFLQHFYNYVAPETRSSRILVFKHLKDLKATEFIDAQECLSVHHLPALSQDSLAVQVFDNGQLLISQIATPSPEPLAEDGVVYTLQTRVETIYAKSQSVVLPNPLTGYASMLSIPTFDDLKAALAEYNIKQARKCSCLILAEAWTSENRLMFRHAPEKVMRNSLTQFLKHTLRGNVEVRPEQIVNATRPVDIKVTWFMSNRLALIEIKWIGASRSKKGKLTKRTDSRAREGAKQLVDYIKANIVQAPAHESRGYLVVIDGRRRGLTPTTKALTFQNGFAYAAKEISFSPEYHKTRSDFEQPVRMFVEPVCTL